MQLNLDYQKTSEPGLVWMIIESSDNGNKQSRLAIFLISYEQKLCKYIFIICIYK